MGNAQSTSQFIVQALENKSSIKAGAQARTTCNQNLDVDFSGSKLTNCTIGTEQKCTSLAQVDMDFLMSALAEASLDSEQKQHAEGLALAMNVSVTDNQMISKTLQELKASCDVDASTLAIQNNTYTMRNTEIDCSKIPDGKLIHHLQLGDAQATCVVKKIINTTSDLEAESTTDMRNEGINPMQLFACFSSILVIVAAVIIIPMILPSKKRDKKTNKSA